jgi:cytochrome c-type biogenesis protein
VPILLFIAGFGVVFTLLGAFTGAATRLLRSSTGLRISGAVIIAFGVLMLLYALRLGSPWLFAERRPLLSTVRPGPAWAFPLGVAFGAGWTPCIAGVSGVVMIAIGVLIVTDLWNQVLAPVRQAIRQFEPPL